MTRRDTTRQQGSGLTSKLQHLESLSHQRNLFYLKGCLAECDGNCSAQYILHHVNQMLSKHEGRHDKHLSSLADGQVCDGMIAREEDTVEEHSVLRVPRKLEVDCLKGHRFSMRLHKPYM